MLRIINISIIIFISVIFSDFYFANAQNMPEDSTSIETIIEKDTLIIPVVSPSGIDSVITFYSADTTKVNLKEKKVWLIGNAQIDFEQQQLNAAIIEIDFNTSIIKADLTHDSTGKPLGVPKMKDGSEEYYGETLTYNIKTNTGTIKMGETQLGEGYYFGEYISRVAKNEWFVADGYYTTCDAEHPHYHFGASKMKMRMGEKLFAENLTLYAEDIPVFKLPFSLYLPLEKGRRSGLIVPSFYFSNSRGVVFQNLGYYWAASDYWDTKFTADIYTKGGYLVNNTTQWALKDIFSGNANISFGNTRYSLDEDYQQEWKIALTHNHIFTPFENANINVNFTSPDFNRNTSTNINTRVQQNIHSGAAYSRTFENGVNASISFQNDQNIISNEYNGTVPLSVSVPQVQFIKKLFDVPANSWYSWVRDMSFTYRGNASYNFSKRLENINQYQVDTGIVYDTIFNANSAGYITHSPSLSITPKFGYFNVTPSINFSANNYFRKTIKNYNSTDSTVEEHFQTGFFTEYNYSFGIGTSTRIYGIADNTKHLFGLIDPNSFGVKAIRHTYQPSVNFSLTPDFSNNNNFYGKYYDERQKREVMYSYFEKEGGSHASSSLQKRLSYSDMHSFEIKKPGKDTLPDENIELLRVTLSLSHNFAADSMNFSDINATFRTPFLKFLDFAGSSSFTLYDEIKNENSDSYTRVNQLLLSNSKGLARLTNFNLNLSTSFSSEGFSSPTNDMNNGYIGADTSSGDSLQTDTNAIDTSLSLGNRFHQRNLQKTDDANLWGNGNAGFSPINMPWSISLGLNFQYNRYNINRIERRFDVNANFNFTIAETWKTSFGFQYDFINKNMITPQLNLTKDLHCWELTASWYPSGYNAGFYLRFGIKSAQLRDMKIEKRDSPIFR